MHYISHATTRVLRTIGGLLGLILTIATVCPSYAVGGAGIQNRTFGTTGVSPVCNLTSWTTSGYNTVKSIVPTASAMTGAFWDCSAMLTATAADTGGGTQPEFAANVSGAPTATLEQSFSVNPSEAWLKFYLAVSSSHATEAYPPIYQKSASFSPLQTQTISLYDNSGALIYSKSRNSSLGTFLFEYNLSGYAYSTITVRVTASATPLLGYQTSSEVKIAVNFRGPDNPTPDGEIPRW